MDTLPLETVDEVIIRVARSDLFIASQVCHLWRNSSRRRVVKLGSKREYRDAGLIGDLLSIIHNWTENHRLLAASLRGACRGGHLITAQWCERRIADFINRAEAVSTDQAEIYKISWSPLIPVYRDLTNREMILKEAYRGGHKELINWASSKCHHSEAALLGACRGGKFTVEEITKRWQTCADWKDAFFAACRGGNQPLVEHLFPVVKIGVPNKALFEACRGRHHETAMWIFQRCGGRLDSALNGACRAGDWKLVQWAIDLGARGWDDAFCWSCRAGDRQLAQYFLDKGSRVFDSGLEAACGGGYKDLAEWIIALSPEDVMWKPAMRSALDGGHPELAKWLFDKYCKGEMNQEQ